MMITIEKLNEEDVCLQFNGGLDETIEFPKLDVRLSQRIIFECRKIDHLNSLGIQKWILFFRAMKEEQQFVFRECPQRLIDAFNLIAEFFPKNVVVESFFVPYQCEKCQHESDQLMLRGKDFIEKIGAKPPKLMFPSEINCPKCQSRMMISVWENVYFRFLERL